MKNSVQKKKLDRTDAGAVKRAGKEKSTSKKKEIRQKKKRKLHIAGNPK